MSADREVLRGLADKLERSLKQDTVGCLLKFMIEHGSDVLAALRASQSDGAAAMREAAAACAAGWRTPALKHTGLNEVEQDIARRTAAGIESAILGLPLAQPGRPQETATGGETA